RKGLHTLLEAVSNQRSAISVDVVGSLSVEPEYVEKIKKIITKNNLSSFIFLHNSLNNEPLKEKLKNAHILIVPSSYEGFGIVYLEGMCFGLPAIGTTAGAASEVIEGGKTSFLIEPNDSESLANIISNLAEYRELLVELSLNARKRYIQQPIWEETASQIRAFLLGMIGKQEI
ncbi:MAG TPA: glycosyltransferase family 4 protein, partial [Anaerolineales bacterium]|nr:glycosyltransferase family 4 protein [Anaerolineales bacterium]